MKLLRLLVTLMLLVNTQSIKATESQDECIAILKNEITSLRKEQMLQTSIMNQVKEQQITCSYTYFAAGMATGAVVTIILVFFEGVWLTAGITCVGGLVGAWYFYPSQIAD